MLAILCLHQFSATWYNRFRKQVWLQFLMWCNHCRLLCCSQQTHGCWVNELFCKVWDTIKLCCRAATMMFVLFIGSERRDLKVKPNCIILIKTDVRDCVSLAGVNGLFRYLRLWLDHCYFIIFHFSSSSLLIWFTNKISLCVTVVLILQLYLFTFV